MIVRHFSQVHEFYTTVGTSLGGGYVASVDGIRFVVPVRSVNAGPNPRYFGQGRRVTYLNYTSDQFSGLGGLVIPGTIRDSVYALEALLEQESGLTPQKS